jgi:hypothetical protein
MVLQKLQLIITLSSLLLVTTTAFSTRKASQLVRSSPSPSFALNAGAVVMDDTDNEQDGGTDIFLMNRATACANSETCSLEEAQTYLEDIILMQKDCLDATLQDIQNPLCENVDVVAEVVAGLRSKIELERSRVTVNALNVAVGVYVVSTILHGFAAVPNVPVDAPFFTSFDAWDATAINDRGVTTILPQEWFWAFRDGYFPALFSEWFRNGGLVVDMSAFDSKAIAFTPQEWLWSIQNGSFGNLFQENFRNGGYLVDSTFDTEGMTPMTSQDVLWSIQGGYLDTAMKHFFRNGGV